MSTSCNLSLLFVALLALTPSAKAYSPCPNVLQVTFQCPTRVTIDVASSGFNVDPAGFAEGEFEIDTASTLGSGLVLRQDDDRLFQAQVYSTSNNAHSASARAFSGLNFLNAEASGSVNMSLGELRAKIGGESPISFLGGSRAQVEVLVVEQVRFVPPPGMGDFIVRVTMDIEGTISGTRPAPTLDFATFALGSTSLSLNAPAAYSQQVFEDYLIPVFGGLTAAIPISAFVRLTSGVEDGTFDIDFSSTARLSLQVPDGVTWTSASGNFLSAVPEPSALGMGLAGLVLISLLKFRRVSATMFS